jgi:hypothetical protein
VSVVDAPVISLLGALKPVKILINEPQDGRECRLVSNTAKAVADGRCDDKVLFDMERLAQGFHGLIAQRGQLTGRFATRRGRAVLKPVEQIVDSGRIFAIRCTGLSSQANREPSCHGKYQQQDSFVHAWSCRLCPIEGVTVVHSADLILPTWC